MNQRQSQFCKLLSLSFVLGIGCLHGFAVVRNVRLVNYSDEVTLERTSRRSKVGWFDFACGWRVAPSSRAGRRRQQKEVQMYDSCSYPSIISWLFMSLSRRVSVSYTPSSASNSPSSLLNPLILAQDSSEFLRLCSTLAKGQAETSSMPRRCDS